MTFKVSVSCRVYDVVELRPIVNARHSILPKHILRKV